MIEYQTEDILLDDERPGLDLVITIDKSGSMRGNKIKLVKETLIFIVDELKEIDRLSLVTFSNSS